LFHDGPVTAAAWQQYGAPQALHGLQHYQYGWLPPPVAVTGFEVVVPEAVVLDGHGVRSVLRLRCGLGDQAWQADVLIVRPRQTEGPVPVPVITGLNFRGNHTTCLDPDIPLHTAYIEGTTPRGEQARRWDFAQAIQAGYAVATLCCAEIHVDSTDSARIDAASGINRLWGRLRQDQREAHSFGAIAAWAWGLQRLVDGLTTLPWVNAQRIGVMGHSRLGKAALLACASDPRIAWCIDNQSGTAGGALSRKSADTDGAETLAQVARFQHWFCPAFQDYAANPQRLPYDQHHLLAAIAPRPLLLAYAVDDHWGDPPGAFHAARLAAPAWAISGFDPALSDQLPDLNHVVGQRLAFHLRPGGHDVLPQDWTTYLHWLAAIWP